MKHICIALIKFYQLFISPYKGFRCAHHVLHQRECCSNRVKDLIMQYGLIGALPLVRVRFAECRKAYEYLQSVKQPTKGHVTRADLPYALPCDVGVGDCGGDVVDSSPSECWSHCDLPFNWSDFSRRTKRIIIIVTFLSVLCLSYVFYGRDINAVYLVDLGEQNQSIFKRAVQRENPQVRVLLLANGKKVYSEIINLDLVDYEYKLRLDKLLSNFEIDSLKILDARVNIANKALVIGQVLEEFDKPKKEGQSERFQYRIKRRWHF